MCQIRVPPLGPHSSDKWAEFWFSALLREIQLPSLPFLQPKSEFSDPRLLAKRDALTYPSWHEDIVPRGTQKHTTKTRVKQWATALVTEQIR